MNLCIILSKLIFSIDKFLLPYEYKTRMWIDESEATVLEWRTTDTIIGIAIEKDPEDSGWFFARSGNKPIALCGKLNEEFRAV